MSCVLRVITIYILLDLSNDALAETEATEPGSGEISVEIDGLGEDERTDVNNDQIKLMSVDYYNGRAVDSRENYDDENLISNRDDVGAKIVILDSMDTRNYKAEMKAGNKADILGTNPHYYQPDLYPNFSRRFVLQYPYTEVVNKRDEIKTDKLTPKLASPELVLAVAEKSALLDAASPKGHNDVEIVRKDILRSGEYWNAVWKEDVDPKVLRTKFAKRTHKKLETVRAEIAPGFKLYDLVSKLKHMSPTLLYVINDKKP